MLKKPEKSAWPDRPLGSYVDFFLVQGLKKLALLLFLIDEIPSYLSSFPNEKETVQLPTLAHAQDIYPPVYHGKLTTL